ncbi:putative ABC transporter permease [Tindallia californiensis]|uniref:Uncharacterized membrane protein n=1 Tax=Tindallia californiensis TaxID=159292 RepID=A0A1H3JXS7_9FIRM|nr:putative ABC transporter permease [Tindallia californiensis]SDY44691.1 Uncharacterized membrane protein [Tindallia californiensis]
MWHEWAFIFLCYGVMGWIWETMYVSIENKKFVNRGFLRSPFIPIYAFAGITMMPTIQWFAGGMEIESVYLFAMTVVLIASVVATLWEYTVSYLMEKAFETRWWDYSDFRFHLNGRIALGPSIFWGVFGMVFFLYIQPFLMNYYERIMDPTVIRFMIILYILLVVDAAYTISELIQLRGIITRFHEVSEILAKQLALIQEGQQDLKTMMAYRRMRGFKDLEEFVDLVRQKKNMLKHEQERKFEEYSVTLQKAKKIQRFYKKYPKALTNKLPYVFYVIRKRKDNGNHRSSKE